MLYICDPVGNIWLLLDLKEKTDLSFILLEILISKYIEMCVDLSFHMTLHTVSSLFPIEVGSF